MYQYPKTENLLARDESTHLLMPGTFRNEEFGLISQWLVTEKVDGTNIRIIFSDSGEYEIRGRSDGANLPSGLEAVIHGHIGGPETVKTLFETLGIPDSGGLGGLGGLGSAPDEERTTVCVYGEGYGPGIQKRGGQYRPKESGKSIRIFDVATTRGGGTWWRPWAVVEAAAAVLGLQTVPVLDKLSATEDIYKEVLYGFASRVAQEDGGEGMTAEGVVARTDPYLFNWRGGRVMFKLKTEDLRNVIVATGAVAGVAE